jgi:lysyl-tRNA synthetase class I
MLSFKDHDHRANFSAVKKFSMNSHKICTIGVRVFAIESSAQWWECHAAAVPTQCSSTLAKLQWQRGWAIDWAQGECPLTRDSSAPDGVENDADFRGGWLGVNTLTL